MLTKEEMLNNFAHNIEEERKSLDFTQVLFSKMLGVSVSTYKTSFHGRLIILTFS